jgi:GTP-binding protein
LHLVEATHPDPIGAYKTIQEELTAYNDSLAIRPQILALSKIDAVDEEELAEILKELGEYAKQHVYLISSATRTGLDPMLQDVWQQLDLLNSQEANELITAQ